MIKNVCWKMNNGVDMPVVGIGTYKATGDMIKLGIELGYRHIDIAPVYGNEKEVGDAITESGVARNELFLSVKIWNDDLRSGDIRTAVSKSLKNLRTDYIDLLLFHWPVAGKYTEAWKKMETLYEEGIVKAIGVSNCTQRQIDELIEGSHTVPAVNQIEIHPHFTQCDVLSYCRNRGIIVQAWSPLGGGSYVTDPILTEIGRIYGKSAAQVLLKWNIQRGCVVIPKASSKEKLLQNEDLFEYDLSPLEIKRIEDMNMNLRTGSDPENFDF